MATIYNRIPPAGELGDITVGGDHALVFNGNGEWTPLNFNGNGIVIGSNRGKSVAISVLDEWMKEQDLELRYPALAAAREQYNIIKALCQETEDDPR